MNAASMLLARLGGCDDVLTVGVPLLFVGLLMLVACRRARPQIGLGNARTELKNDSKKCRHSTLDGMCLFPTVFRVSVMVRSVSRADVPLTGTASTLSPFRSTMLTGCRVRLIMFIASVHRSGVCWYVGGLFRCRPLAPGGFTVRACFGV